MNVPANASLGTVFVSAALIFLGLAFRDYLNAQGQMTPSRKTWLRIAFIFSGVAIGLWLVGVLIR